VTLAKNLGLAACDDGRLHGNSRVAVIRLGIQDQEATIEDLQDTNSSFIVLAKIGRLRA
jgi:hypothetical protein